MTVINWNGNVICVPDSDGDMDSVHAFDMAAAVERWVANVDMQV